MSDQKLKILSIKFKVKDGVEIELPVDEARILYEELNKMFGVRGYSYPIVIDRSWWPPYYTWTGISSTGDKITYKTDTCGKLEAVATTDSGSSITWNCEEIKK